MTSAHNDQTIPYLRKAVEWVEYQAALPEIDREWFQNSYLLPPEDHARVLLDSTLGYVALDDVIQLQEHCGTTYCVAGYLGQLMDERYIHNDVAGGIHVSAFVCKQLGLSVDDGSRLFNGSNTAADVREIAEDIAGQPL